MKAPQRKKRRAKGAGRPRKPKTGHLTKREIKRLAAAERRNAEQDAVSLVIWQRMKFLGIKDVDLAKNPLIPFVPYRWSVMRDGEDTIISRHHYEAAEAYVKLRTEYLRAIKAPLPSVGGGVDPDPDATDSYYVEKCERVRKTYDGIRRELLDQGLFSVVQIIAVDNEDRRQWAGKFRVAMNLVHKLLIGRVDT